MYHGIVQHDIGVWTQIPIRAFKKQMAYIGRHYNPVTMSNALNCLDKVATVSYPVVVTFDDGFRNNLLLAHSILKKHKVPAVIYLTTSFIDGSEYFSGLLWTDYIYALLQSAKAGRYYLNDYGLSEITLGDNESRLMAKKEICAKFKLLPHESRLQAIDKLSRLLGSCGDFPGRETFTPMSWDNVRSLGKDGLITFGAHTVSHPILTRLPLDRVQYEITESQVIIEKQTGEKPDLFAYPNGTRDDFNDYIKELVAQHYICAVSTIEGFNESSTDRYELRRIGMGNDMPLWEFKLRLSGVFDFFK